MTICSENHTKAGPVAIPRQDFFDKPYLSFGLCYCSHLVGIYAINKFRKVTLLKVYIHFFQNIFWRKYAINNYKNQNQS